MTDDSKLELPDGKLTRLKYSITNLWDDLGRTDSAAFGFLVNGGLALIGGVVALFTTGWIQFIAVAWAILNLIPIFKWVLQV